MLRHGLLPGVVATFLMTFSCAHLLAQGVAVEGGVCKPASQRTQEVGCWILADDPVGKLIHPQVFWHLDAYPTHAEAETDKGERGIVLESLGKVWLMTIQDEKWKPAHGTRIAEIGPIPIDVGKSTRPNTWKRSSLLA